MGEKNLFEFVKGLLNNAPADQIPATPRRPARYEMPVTNRPPQPDDHNPATIVRIGKSNDGRELIMTLGFGIYLVDREAPTICFYNRGSVAEVPTLELQRLHDSLLEKRNVDHFALHYVDFINVVSHELEMRRQRRGAATPISAPRTEAPSPPPPAPSAGNDMANPATITRVGRSHNGAELVMTLGLGTFVVHREVPDIRYFDRGREWDIPDQELQVLVDSLMAKQDMSEHRYAYIDLLNVATFVADRRRAGRARR